MRVVCSYCAVQLREIEPLDDPSVSHGMCEQCYAEFERRWEPQHLGTYLDQFSAPTVVVEGSGRVVAANAAMAEMLGRDDRALFGLLGGEAMECRYSRLPGGCGQTVHCQTCAIRQAVTATLADGQTRRRIPASLSQVGGEVHMRITTERRRQTVRITIEEVLAPTPRDADDA